MARRTDTAKRFQNGSRKPTVIRSSMKLSTFPCSRGAIISGGRAVAKGMESSTFRTFSFEICGENVSDSFQSGHDRRLFDKSAIVCDSKHHEFGQCALP